METEIPQMMLDGMPVWAYPLIAGLLLVGLLASALRRFGGRGATAERVLILGTGPLARELVEEIRARGGADYAILGVLAEENPPVRWMHVVPVLGGVDQLQEILPQIRPDRIFIALAERRRRLPVHQLVEARVSRRILVEDGEDVYERLTGKLAIESLRPSNVIFSKEFRPSSRDLMLARALSLAAAVAGLVVLGPLLLLIALLIKLDSRGPVLFVQERVGLAGRKFNLMKFRTMRPEENRRSEWVRDNDDRITRIGKWLRKFRLDELPQFLNILRGDMNLVGPRPHPASNFELFALVSRNTPNCGEQIPYYSLRSMVRPGITGWAQVRYQYANDLDEEIEKMRYDLFYIKHFSPGLDMRIVVDTVKTVVLGREWDPANDEPAKPEAGQAPGSGSAESARGAQPEESPKSPAAAVPTHAGRRANGRDGDSWVAGQAGRQ